MVAEPFGHLGEIGSPAVSPRPSQTSLPPSQTIVQPSQASLRPSQAIAKPSASHEGEIGLLYVYSLAAALCPLVLCCSQLPWGKPLRRDQAALCLLTLCCSLSKPLTEPQSRTGIILLRLRSAANQSQRVSKTRADEFVIWIISCHRRAIWERSCLRDNLLPHGGHGIYSSRSGSSRSRNSTSTTSSSFDQGTIQLHLPDMARQRRSSARLTRKLILRG